jgi:hypothetical protein
LVKATPNADAPLSSSYTPEIAWSTCLSASTTGTTHSTEVEEEVSLDTSKGTGHIVLAPDGTVKGTSADF